MSALQQLLPHLIPQPFNERLKYTLTRKINSCHINNVQGFWLKISEGRDTELGLARVKIEISFLKPLAGAQISLTIHSSFDEYTDEDKAEANKRIRMFHDKFRINETVRLLEDEIVNDLDLPYFDEDYLAKRKADLQDNPLVKELNRLRDVELQEKGIELLVEAKYGDESALERASKAFLEAIRNSQDPVLNMKKLEAAKEAYIKT